MIPDLFLLFIATGFVQFVQVVKSLADALQSQKRFDYEFWFEEKRGASEVERQIVEVEKKRRIWIHVVMQKEV